MPCINRWMIVAAAVLVESIGGLGYIFSVYSEDLKTQFALDQSQLDMLGTLSNLAGNIGIHIGLLQDAVGPSFVVLLGGAIGVAGWLPMYFALSPTTQWRAPYWSLCIFSLLQGQQQLVTDVAVVPTIARNFPHHRGLALGLVKSFVGLSGSIVTQAYIGLYKPDIVPFILFVSICVGVCATVTGAIVRDLPPPERESAASSAHIQKVFGIGYILTALLAFLLVSSATAIQFVPGANSQSWRIGLTAATFALLFGIVAFFYFQRDATPRHEQSIQRPHEESGDLGQSLLPRQQQPSALLREYTMLQSMATLDFWILFVAFFFSSGAGLIIINNLGQLVPAVGGADGDVGTYVSILSVCNCIGRLVCGVVGDWALMRHSIPRPVVFGWFIWMMVLAMGLLAIGTVPALYAATIVGGVSYGALNGITPPILSEMYGNAHFGAIYTANALAEGAGSYVMATWLFSVVYEHSIAERRDADSASGSADNGDGSKDCLGRQCFLLTAWVSAALCSASALLCVWLGRRTQQRYDALCHRA